MQRVPALKRVQRIPASCLMVLQRVLAAAADVKNCSSNCNPTASPMAMPIQAP